MPDAPPSGDPTTRRALRLYGVLAAVLGGLMLALTAGGGGASGLAGLLVGLALASALVGLYATLTAVRDLIVERPVGRSRAALAAATFVATPMLMVMAASLGA